MAGLHPLLFFDEKGYAYGVNGEATRQAFDNTYCDDLTEMQAITAVKKDIICGSSLNRK